MVRFGGRQEFGILLEVDFEVVAGAFLWAFGHGVFCVEDIQEVVIFLGNGLFEFPVSFLLRGQVAVGGVP